MLLTHACTECNLKKIEQGCDILKKDRSRVLFVMESVGIFRATLWSIFIILLIFIIIIIKTEKKKLHMVHFNIYTYI